MPSIAQRSRPQKKFQGLALEPATLVDTQTATTSTTTHTNAIIQPTTTATTNVTSSKAMVDQAQITRNQSTMIVKTMLDATFGCVTFLRNLLPEDNFEDSHIAPSSNPTKSSKKQLHLVDEDSQGSSQANPSQGTGNLTGKNSGSSKGLRIKKLKRGYSPEADKVLDWLDIGIMDAVEKQYLKTCVFGVYLDPEKPENMVEALTISFHYPTVPGTNISVPQMTISDAISAISLSQSADEEVSLGLRLKTFGEVKSDVRKLIRSLIVLCQNMGEIPAQRFATMKLYYTDETPEEYEPPYFVPLPEEKKTWYMGTHDVKTQPERYSVGDLQTGFHSMSVKLTSVVDILPSAPEVAEEDKVAFGPTEAEPSVLGKRRRELDEERLRSDATKRKFIWNADMDANDRQAIDPAYQDAEGEIDDQLNPSQVQALAAKPYGMLSEDGTIILLGRGQPERIPKAASSQVVSPTLLSNGENSRLQDVDLEHEPIYIAQGDDATDQMDIDILQLATTHGPGRIPADGDDVEPMDIDRFTEKPTHNVALAKPNHEDARNGGVCMDGDDDSIVSFSQGHANLDAPEQVEQIESATPAVRRSQRHTSPIPIPASPVVSRKTTEKVDKVDCPCADHTTDDTMVGCEGCQNWLHLPCTGYMRPDLLPDTFYCLKCIVRLTGVDVEDKLKAIRNFLPGIAIMRRALWIGLTEGEVPDATQFSKRLGCGPQDMKMILDRMIADGYLAPHNSTANMKKGKVRPLKIDKGWRFVNDITRSNKLRTWFDRGGTMERKELGIDKDMIKMYKNWHGEPHATADSSNEKTPTRANRRNIQEKIEVARRTGKRGVAPKVAATKDGAENDTPVLVNAEAPIMVIPSTPRNKNQELMQKSDKNMQTRFRSERASRARSFVEMGIA